MEIIGGVPSEQGKANMSVTQTPFGSSFCFLLKSYEEKETLRA
jgi:hypothetical protein